MLDGTHLSASAEVERGGLKMTRELDQSVPLTVLATETMPIAPIDGISAQLNKRVVSGVEAGVETVRVSRIDKHEVPMGDVAGRLRQLGLGVAGAAAGSGYDLLVDRRVRVALRVAYPGYRRHRVRVRGRTYQYRYRTWHFNFHHHGTMEDRYADYFVCTAMLASGGINQIFVIPWGEVSGKTFSLHCGRSEYRGRYAKFRDAWEVIARGPQQQPSSVERGLPRVA